MIATHEKHNTQTHHTTLSSHHHDHPYRLHTRHLSITCVRIINSSDQQHTTTYHQAYYNLLNARANIQPYHDPPTTTIATAQPPHSIHNTALTACCNAHPFSSQSTVTANGGGVYTEFYAEAPNTAEYLTRNRRSPLGKTVRNYYTHARSFILPPHMFVHIVVIAAAAWLCVFVCVCL